jgi:hypothetical protein
MDPLHYKPKKISEIDAKTDTRVSLQGTVASFLENSFVLDDGSGKVEIASETIPEQNKKVRVFCSIVDEQLKSDMIQDLTNLDLDLFNKVKELYNKSGV